MSETTQLPYAPDTAKTHYEGCWRQRGHHNCAVLEVERLREKASNVVMCFVDWPAYQSESANGERERALLELATTLAGGRDA